MIITVDGEHDTVVVVGRRLTVIVADVVVELPACAVSVVAGVYDAVMLAEPEWFGVNVTLHVAVPTGFVP